MTLSPRDALKLWYPEFPKFRDKQELAIERLLAGSSVLLLMPTGGGKSLVYQLPVLAKGGIGLVISPLIALMREQAEKLNARGINALSLGGLEQRDAQEALRSFSWSDAPGFLFTSPERAETDGLLEHLLRVHRSRIALVTIDEAHCVSQWGHDFRPPYKALPRFFDRAFGLGAWPPRLCLTATLDKRSETEVLEDFSLTPGDVIRSTHMIRDNLHLSCRRFPDTDTKLHALEGLLEEHRGEKAIVYAHLKQNKQAGTRALAKRLHNLGHSAAAFDADLPLGERDDVVSAFTRGEIRVVCATGAFGMGVDIPDIRGIVHFLLPESLEQYYQEVGRAGRDGEPAFGILLYAPKNAKVREDMIEASRISAEQVTSAWKNLIESGRSAVRSINPSMEFQASDADYALFHAFQRVGALEVVARGPTRLGAYEPRGPEGTKFLNRLRANTKTGNFLAAFRKLDIDPAEGYRQLFDLYVRSELKLTRSPDTCLVFRGNELSPEDAEQIACDFNAKIDKRLSDFRDLRDLIETDSDLEDALRLRFSRGDD